MSYRNKTYVAFASENIHLYYMMKAWRDNEKIDFSFFDSHDLYQARDTSSTRTIQNRLRERISNTAKQVVLIGTEIAKTKGSDGNSFLAYEIDTIIRLKIPVVIANTGGSREIEYNFIPKPFIENSYPTLSTSFQAATIKFALDNYASNFSADDKVGPLYYQENVYQKSNI